ncbi:MAG TPA: lipoyl(octanoyl) transferase LipB [Solirubrobacterales bacterium]|jgi:lipoyl(octanoyl) transferase|nr:lipoyl(octanoyl) transferase LipB [Solirubrobacterales bacterium]
MSETVSVVRCGTLTYERGLEVQSHLEGRRQREEIGDVLLLLQHYPVYTRGRRVTEAELPMGAEWYEAQGIAVRETNRGGQVTYHGPGQLVAYPIVGLAPYGDDVHAFVRGLEQVMIGALAEHGVQAGLIEGKTGVWVGERKIGSIGVHVSRGVTTHGLAVNVNNDLQPFEWVIPCGIEGCQVTSLTREHGAEQDFDAFAATVAARFGQVFERTPQATAPSELGLELPTATLEVSR